MNLIFVAPGQQAMQSKALEDHKIVGLDGGNYPRITMKGNRFHIMGADGIERLHEQTYLHVVILDTAQDINKAWWSSLEAEGPPDCWSDDGRVPVGPESTRPIISVGAANIAVRSCAECPKQLEGSKGDGTNFKACSTKKRIAVLLPDEITADSLGTIYQLNLGAWSLGDKYPAAQSGPRGLRQYHQFLKSQTAVGPNGVALNAIITRLDFATDESVPVLRFSVAARNDGHVLWLPVETQDRIASELLGTDDLRNVLYPAMTNRNSVRSTTGPNPTQPVLTQVAKPALSAPATVIPASAPAPVAAPTSVAPPKPKAAPPVPAPKPAPVDNATVLAKLLDLFEAAFPDQFADTAGWATHAETKIEEAIGWFKDNVPELYAKATTPLPAPPKLVAPPVAPAALAKPAARKPPGKPAEAPVATVLAPSGDSELDEMASILGQLGADL